MPEQRGTSHRWVTAEADERARRREARREGAERAERAQRRRPALSPAVAEPGPGVESRSERA
ncbi:hypothetical protein ACFQH9_28740, partial [Pseudonocardia lutea]